MAVTLNVTKEELSNIELLSGKKYVIQLSTGGKWQFDFFRSEDHSKGRLSREDRTYNGDFGFDRYNSKVDPHDSGLDDISVHGQKYYVPWLVLWPPLSVINSNASFSALTAQEKAYLNPCTKAELYIKCTQADRSQRYTKNKPDKLTNPLLVECRYDNKSNAVASTIKLTHAPINELYDNMLIKIDVECTGILTDNACLRITNPGGNVLGQLNIKKNNEVYMLKTRFVQVNFYDSTAGTPTFVPINYNNTLNHFNHSAFNQSLIYAVPPQTSMLNIPSQELVSQGIIRFAGDYKQIEYNTENQNKLTGLILNQYYTQNTHRVGTPKSTATAEGASSGDISVLTRKAKAAIKKIDAAFNDKKVAASPQRFSLTSKDKDVKEKVDEFNSKYGVKITAGTSVSDPKKLMNYHVTDEAEKYIKNAGILMAFICGNVDKSVLSTDSGPIENPGYSVPLINKVIIGNNVLTKPDTTGFFVHEMGHALGLGHIFDEDIEQSSSLGPGASQHELLVQVFSKNLEKLKGKIKDLSKDESAYNTENNEYLAKRIKQRKEYIVSTTKTLLDMLEGYTREESKGGTGSTGGTADNTVYNTINEGGTKENFMDYFKDEEYVKGVQHYKSFTMKQTETMQSSGFVKKVVL